MIGEVIGLVVIVGALTTLAIYAITATQRAGKQEARGDTLAVRLEVQTANTYTEAARADREKERGDALDAAISRVAARAVGPVAGSFAELLQEAADARARATGRRGALELRDTGAASGPAEADRRDPDALLRPGE